MARLTNYDREQIIKKMRPLFYSKVTEVQKEVEEMLNKFIKHEIPQEVFDFTKKYPGLASTMTSVYYNSGNDNFYFQVERFPRDFFKGEGVIDVMKKRSDEDAFKTLLSKFNDEVEKAYSLKKRATCVLENISTENKLKNEFPEAYTAHREIYDNETTTVSTCDTIENVRAELSKIKKGEKE